MHRANLVADGELDAGTLTTQPIGPGIYLTVGTRRGSRTVEGAAYLFDPGSYTPDAALTWLSGRGVTFRAFTAATDTSDTSPPNPDVVPAALSEAQDDDTAYRVEEQPNGHFTLRNVPVLAEGSWDASSGGEYEATEARMRALVDSTMAVIDQLQPPVGLGHGDPILRGYPKGGEPAFGWIRRVKAAGKQILADLADVPKALVEAIEQGHFKRQSLEIARDWKDTKTGRELPEVISGLAILGTELPAVPVLDALRGRAFTGNRNTVWLLSRADAEPDGPPNQEPEPKETDDMTEMDALQRRLEAMRGQVVEQTIQLALSTRRLRPGQVETERRLLLSLPEDALDVSCQALLSRPELPDETKVQGHPEGPPPGPPPDSDLPPEDRMVKMSRERAALDDIDLATAMSRVCAEHPEVYEEYRRQAFRPLTSA